MSFSITPQVNMALQALTLTILLASLVLKRMRKHLLHGATMLVSVALNAASFLLIMGPSLLNLREFITLYTFDQLALAAMIHAALGTVAEALGIYIVVLWLLKPTIQRCIRRKKLMRRTFVLWVSALVIGIILNRLLYP